MDFQWAGGGVADAMRGDGGPVGTELLEGGRDRARQGVGSQH